MRANIDVTLTVRPATVHALVGENGAGKTTLVRMLYGLDQPDSGAIVINDREMRLAGPRAAIAEGIGLVQQELAIIPELTLLENLVLGNEPRRFGWVDWVRARRTADELATSAGVTIDWDADAAQTPIAIQQQVEILRLVYRGADVLILDEPTAMLAPAQATQLLQLFSSLRDTGRTVIFISHKLDEVIGVADRVTVLRSGRAVAEYERGEIDREGLTALIMGGATTETGSAVTEAGAVPLSTSGQTVLTARGISAHDDRGISRLDGVGFEVRAGEILGIAAVAGNGQEELAEVLIGIRATTAGEIRLHGVPLGSANVRRRRLAGMAFVSSDRKQEGLALSLNIAENSVATPALRDLSRLGWMRPRTVARRAEAVLERAAVRYGAATDPVSTLSGGNQQRVVIGRETYSRVAVLIASQPTRGVDIKGISYIHDAIRRARDDGAAVVLFSEELDELRELSDRILVLYRGQVAGVLPAETSRASIGELMLGHRRERAGK